MEGTLSSRGMDWQGTLASSELLDVVTDVTRATLHGFLQLAHVLHSRLRFGLGQRGGSDSGLSRHVLIVMLFRRLLSIGPLVEGREGQKEEDLPPPPLPFCAWYVQCRTRIKYGLYFVCQHMRLQWEHCNWLRERERERVLPCMGHGHINQGNSGPGTRNRRRRNYLRLPGKAFSAHIDHVHKVASLTTGE